MANAPRRTCSRNLLAAVAWALGGVVPLLGTSCDFAASPPLRSISVNPASVVVATGSLDQMTAVGALADGTFANITYQVQWRSSNTAVAVVSRDGEAGGLVAGVAPGIVTISASLSGLSGSTQLQVR